MERLTFEGNFCDISMCRENPCPYNGSCSQREVWERLKQYEGTGLTPEDCVGYRKFEDEIIASGKTFERLVKLLRADKEGHVVVLPCKVGETVYLPTHKGTICSHKIRRFEQNKDGNYMRSSILIPLDDIGKTVFLTREEAEEALRRAENG